MSDSNAPEWLVDLVRNQMRLMASSPQSVADAVWWEFQRRVELEIKESLDLNLRAATDPYLVQGTVEYRFKEREDVT